MNQEKIGKFIAINRKKKKLTQSELAEKLGLSDRTISKWENGHGLPDPSIFKLLCDNLDITLNELLNGENDFKDNINNGYINYLDYSNKRHKKNIVMLFSSFILILLLILCGIFFLNNYGKTIGYKLYGNSNNFQYSDSSLIISSEKIIFNTGKLQVINTDLSIDDIISVQLISNDENLMFINVLDGTSLIIENNGYNEIFTNNIIDNLDKWSLKIKFLNDNEIVEDIIKIINEELIKTDKFFNKKVIEISDNVNRQTEMFDKEFNPIELRNKLLNFGFVSYEDNTVFRTKAQQYFMLKKEINDILFVVDCYNFNIDIEGHRKDNWFTSNYNFDNKEIIIKGNNKQGLFRFNYNINTESGNCSNTNCNDNSLEIAKDIYNVIKNIFY